MKAEFLKKWSNWWTFSRKRKQLDDAFEKELNELIEQEVALRIHDFAVQSEQLPCEHPYSSVIGEEHGNPKCLKCGEEL